MPDKDKSDLQRLLAGLQEQLVLERACSYALAGNHRAGEELLTRILRNDPVPAGALDLAARICAQAGQYDKARDYWLRARDAEADPAGFSAQLARLKHIQRWPLLLPLRRAVPVFTIVLIVVTAVGLGQKFLQRHEVAAAVPAIRVADARVIRRNSDIQLKFDSGLFYYGAVLKADAKRTLASLASQIRGLSHSHTVLITGHTNNIPLPKHPHYADNYGLGLARAMSVMNYMRKMDGMKDAGYVLRSVGATNPPYTNSTSEGRSRNMTVSITLTPINK